VRGGSVRSIAREEAGVRGWWHSLALAFGFMTRLPVPHVEVRPGDLTRASAVFGVVGLVVAAVGVLVRLATEPVWGPVVGSVAGVLAMTAVTGAFHEDGLADTADGIWGGWQPDERLRIMRDSRLGTYGVVALVGGFALRFALLATTTVTTFAVAIVCAHVLGRSAGPLLVRLAPALPAGSGAHIAGPLGRRSAVLAVVTSVAPVLLAAGVVPGAAAVVTAVAVTALGARWFRRRLGGITGDTIGATTVAVEIAVIALIVAWPGIGV
jgi:adenosylcobinamide-GDP ribazoletransferase